MIIQKMALLSLILPLVLILASLHQPGCCGLQQTPPVPAWPEQFTSEFIIRVGIYGPEWNSTGVVYYDWTNKTFRADYINWCLPLFDSGPTEYNNYTCSFLATGGSMYFVNHTAKEWKEHQCCLFEKGLAAVPPDWMKNDIYNGTDVLRGVLCDLWWFPGTSDPENPCYGYWDARDRVHTPIRFFGLSSIGPTVLDYYTFDIGPPTSHLDLPNSGCFEQCKPPSRAHPMKTRADQRGSLRLPHFPSCD